MQEDMHEHLNHATHIEPMFGDGEVKSMSLSTSSWFNMHMICLMTHNDALETCMKKTCMCIPT